MNNKPEKTYECLRAEQNARLWRAVNKLNEALNAASEAYENETDELIKASLLEHYKRIVIEYEHFVRIYRKRSI